MSDKIIIFYPVLALNILIKRIHQQIIIFSARGYETYFRSNCFVKNESKILSCNLVTEIIICLYFKQGSSHVIVSIRDVLIKDAM